MKCITYTYNFIITISKWETNILVLSMGQKLYVLWIQHYTSIPTVASHQFCQSSNSLQMLFPSKRSGNICHTKQDLLENS